MRKKIMSLFKRKQKPVQNKQAILECIKQGTHNTLENQEEVLEVIDKDILLSQLDLL